MQQRLLCAAAAAPDQRARVRHRMVQATSSCAWLCCTLPRAAVHPGHRRHGCSERNSSVASGSRPVARRAIVHFARVVPVKFAPEMSCLQRINKLLYRSKQRGILELDLIVGEYAEKHLPQMNDAQLQHFDDLLTQEENPDMWKWLTMQVQAPDHLQDNPVFKVSNSGNFRPGALHP